MRSSLICACSSAHRSEKWRTMRACCSILFHVATRHVGAYGSCCSSRSVAMYPVEMFQFESLSLSYVRSGNRLCHDMAEFDDGEVRRSRSRIEHTVPRAPFVAYGKSVQNRHRLSDKLEIDGEFKDANRAPCSREPRSRRRRAFSPSRLAQYGIGFRVESSEI